MNMRNLASVVRTAAAVILSIPATVAFAALPTGDVAWLSSAVSSAKEGSVVEVPTGEYLLTATLMPSYKNVTIRSATGDPADVVLNGQDACRCFATGQTGMKLVGLTFVHGRVAGLGGAVQIVGADAVVSNCVFEFCRSTSGHGGALYLGAKDAVVADCTFRTNCVAALDGSKLSASGGAIGVQNSAVAIRDCTFVGNVVSNATSFQYGGGAIGCDCGGGATKITGCSFTGNVSSYGGAIFGLPLLVENCHFTNNWGKTVGAMAFLHYRLQSSATQYAPTFFKDCTGYTNRCLTGMIGTRENERFYLEGCTIESGVCTAARDSQGGGALSAKDYETGSYGSSLLSVSNCVFRHFNNPSTSQRSPFFGNRDRPKVVWNSTFEDIKLKDNYTTLFYLGDNGRVENCRFIGNRFTGNVHFSCVRFAGTNVLIRNCLFATNYCAQAMGVCIGPMRNASTGAVSEQYWAKMDNCTFAGNIQGTASTWAGYCGIVHMTSNTVMRNCLFYQNKDGANRTVWSCSGSLNPAPTQAKNIFNCYDANATHQLTADVNACQRLNATAAAVGFVDPDPGKTFDYALGKDSPCVDEGLDLDWIFKGVTRDIRNQRRFKRFRGDHPDIGAWEYAPPIGFAMVIK